MPRLAAAASPGDSEADTAARTVDRSSETAVEVLVIGEALIDITSGPDGSREVPGGGPANVALGLGRRGVDVALLTNLGRDARGSAITRHLEKSGVWVLAESFVRDTTSTAVATITADGSARYDFDVRWAASQAPLHVRPRAVHTGSVAAFLGPGDAVVLQQLDRLQPDIVTFDPNIRPALISDAAHARSRFEEFARRATVVKLSDEDAEFLYPDVAIPGVLDAIGSLGPRLVAVTRGSQGAVLAAEGLVVEVPGRAVSVLDTIGAGDTFMSSLIFDYIALEEQALSAETLADIGGRAATAASITVARAGADLPWQHELAELA
ncbi:carbohydrate kinase [Microbacterium sp. SS28]|uniref:carbohydrate kinase family protein n=1 Tax=Microbacterium sp. SS28 TaxID=2919948 RepID=UPI001FA99555|nr:carbohydrate kinase [Microbacterium sp. SS28]